MPGKKEKNKDSKKLLIVVLLAIILILASLLIFNLNPKSNSSDKIAVAPTQRNDIENKNVQTENPVKNKTVSQNPLAGEKSLKVNSVKNNKISK